ncbi:uncharacterized protein [Rutidosis leptorrhynchoides]|uniref:uncharacterized protein n=1 Tax=Rutidosis leptorrhynchoides TaxID=125765 RepID=UPI003A9941AC
MAYHIWNIITCKQTLWVKWIHNYRLQHINFWVVDNVASGSWGWRKILSIRHRIRHLIFHVIGNGLQTSAWYDSWNDFGPLADVITSREIHHATLNKRSKVDDLIDQAEWKWPPEWVTKFPLLMHIPIPNLAQVDRVFWKDSEGNLVNFSSNATWKSLRPRAQQVEWFSMVWYPNCIPRHSFISWLLMGEHLKTHDKLRSWDVRGSIQGMMACYLCKSLLDSHTHLFFECSYSKQVWDKIKRFILIPGIGDNWKVIIQLIISYAHRRVARVMLAKFIFGATVYFIWQESNTRLSKGESRDPNKLFNIIYWTVRLKLMSVKFKDSHHVRKMKIAWQI